MMPIGEERVTLDEERCVIAPRVRVIATNRASGSTFDELGNDG